MRRSVTIAALAVAVAAGQSARAASGPDAEAIEAAAHGAYVAAINSNDTDKLMAVVTDDVVYQAPNEPELVGRAAVRKWVAAYFGGYATQWQKTSIGFTVSGDWAFERYTYVSTDTDRKTGAVTTDRGKGINVFHHEPDGHWRVAIDGWSSDLAPAR